MSDHIGDTHEMVKGYEEARVTRTEEIKARVEKASCGPWQVVRKGEPDNDWLLATFGAASDDDQEVELHTDGVRGDGLSSAENDAEFCAHARTDVPHLLSALQKVEADRNRYIQRAGSAEGRLEVMEADLQALREENARLKGALNQLDAAAGEVITMEEARYVGTPLTVEPWIDRLADAIHIARLAALSSSPAQEEKK